MNMKLKSSIGLGVLVFSLSLTSARAAGSAGTTGNDPLTFSSGANAQTPSAQPQYPSTTNSSSNTGEDWKGEPGTSQWTLAAMTGLGVVNATPGWAIMGAAAKKIIDQGFIPDINNSVWVEGEVGPVIAKGSAGVLFSAHLRWDFVKSEYWTFYALGGFGGASTGEGLGDKFEFYPRFAAGALWNIFADFTLRGEISHELIAVGVQFPF